jgi:SAM-dependent methyltransferase
MNRIARGSREAVVLPDGLGGLAEGRWSSLLAWCREILKPDGVLVSRFPGATTNEVELARTILAGHFGAMEMFYWDGMRRASRTTGDGELFAICRPFVPYQTRSLELLRPRVVTAAEWKSTWLCEHPSLPARFLLRASVDVIGEDQAVDVRLRFITPQRTWFKVQGRLTGSPSSGSELLISSHQAAKRGDPRWEEVERIALDIVASGEASVDVRVSDVRICHCDSSPRSYAGRSSAHLREDYDENYYKGMTGFEEYQDSRGLRGYVNVHRAYSLLPSTAPARAVDIGCGRGELAKHLIDEGGEVTLLDYSPAALRYARAFIGESAQAHFVVDDAANLGEHVAEQSQEAIFMTDFVEHLEVNELRAVLNECRRALAPHGALVIHTPERYSGAIVTAKAIHGLHVNLFEIRTLRALLEEMFEAVDVFTWNGWECFSEPGYCIELFAVARPHNSLITRSLSFTADAVDDLAGDAGSSRWVLERPELPEHFILDATVDAFPASAEGMLEIAFLSSTGELLAQVTRRISSLTTLPACLRLSSELLREESPSDWAQAVQRVVISAKAQSGMSLALTVSRVLLHTSETLSSIPGADDRSASEG